MVGCIFFNISDDNFPLNDDFAYYVYLHQSGDITSEQ